MAGWNWRRGGLWLQRLGKWRNRIQPLRLRRAVRVLNQVARPISTRYYAEAFKDLAVGIIAGLVAGLIVARFSAWLPTFAGGVMALMAIGFAVTALGFGGALAILANLRDEEVKGQDVIEAQDAAAAARVARIVVWVIGLLFLAMTIVSLKALTIISETPGVPRAECCYTAPGLITERRARALTTRSASVSA